MSEADPDTEVDQLAVAGDPVAAAPIALADLATHVEAEPRPGSPWVMVNMVTSLDGATAVDGVSGGLGDAADRATFLALRGVADVVLVGSGTVTVERYRRARLAPDQSERRRGRGQAPTPRIAVVSNAGTVDLELPLFADGPEEARPIVLVASEAVTTDRRRALEQVAEVVEAGSHRVDPTRAVTALADRVGPIVLCEGGPVLNGLLVGADLVDEWCLTVAPLLVAGGSDRAVTGPAVDRPRAMSLDRAWAHQDQLLLRYVRRLGSVAFDSTATSRSKSAGSSNPL